MQGNLEFVNDDQEQASVVNSDENLNIIAYLLGSEPRLVEKALCYRVVAAAQSEVVDKGHHAKDASHGRDALAKVILSYLRTVFYYPRETGIINVLLSLTSKHLPLARLFPSYLLILNF